MAAPIQVDVMSRTTEWSEPHHFTPGYGDATGLMHTHPRRVDEVCHEHGGTHDDPTVQMGLAHLPVDHPVVPLHAHGLVQ